MDYKEIAKKYSPYLRAYYIPLILGFFGLMFLGYGLIGYFATKKDKPDILFEAASDFAEMGNNLSPAEQGKQQKKIVVDIEGAVERPGVYELAFDSRMQDALIAAGGLGRGADREIVARNLNLATKLTDGMKIYVPYEGDEITTDTRIMIGEKNVININSASAQELDELPGIGEITADKIISNRPYTVIESLVDKKIVGQKVFEQIKDKIVAQ